MPSSKNARRNGNTDEEITDVDKPVKVARQPGEEITMRLILPGLYTFTGLIIGRVYAIEDDDGLTLVDAGIKRSARKILLQLAQTGKKPDQVKRIIVTHAHPDHIGGLPELAAATGAQVICSAREREYVEGLAAAPVAPKEAVHGIQRLLTAVGGKPLPGTPVTRTVEDGEIIDSVFARQGGLQVVATPGHSPGHIALWQLQLRLLITGDTLSRMGSSGLTLPFPAFTFDMAQARQSVAKIAALNAEIVIFGHGTPLTTNAAAVMHAFAAKATAEV